MKNSAHTLFAFLSSTPWWVYFIFIYCVYKGFQALRPLQTSVGGLFILPGISLALFTYSLIKTTTLESKTVAYAITIVIVGLLIGFLFAITHKPTINKKKHIFIVPGSIWVPILIMTTFVFQYYCGYIAATNLAMSQNTTFLISKIFIGGIISGLANGRALGYLYKYYKA